MIYVDDRTDAEKVTHNWVISATDRVLSGWGLARGGVSKCGWACRPEDAEAVFAWVHSRDDMKYVRCHSQKWRPRSAMHAHLYVVHDDHPALIGGEA